MSPHLIDTLKHLKIDKLTDKEKDDLRKILEAHKKDLELEAGDIDEQLKRLKK